MITQLQFDVLMSYCLSGNSTKKSIDDFSNKYSKNEFENAISELILSGFLDENGITDLGKEALEPFKVKRAIFLAAGFGLRMVPVTYTVPKPLIKIGGVRIIDTLIDACLNAGIEEIYIVRGYLKEKFDELLVKYPMIKFIDNPYYNEANNISSAFLVRNLLQNAYIFEADMILSNPTLIKKYNYSSKVFGCFCKETDDWSVESDEKGFATEHIKGGKNIWKQGGIYYLNGSDGLKYASHVENIYLNTQGGKNIYWEDVIHKYYLADYKIEITPFNCEDITEIDTFEELIAIDSSYKDYDNENK